MEVTGVSAIHRSVQINTANSDIAIYDGSSSDKELVTIQSILFKVPKDVGDTVDPEFVIKTTNGPTEIMNIGVPAGTTRVVSFKLQLPKGTGLKVKSTVAKATVTINGIIATLG